MHYVHNSSRSSILAHPIHIGGYDIGLDECDSVLESYGE